MRTIIDIPDEQIQGLSELCERESISRAEAIRQAVHIMLAQKNRKNQTQSLSAFFGMWKDRDDIGDAVDYQQALRAEWDRE